MRMIRILGLFILGAFYWNVTTGCMGGLSGGGASSFSNPLGQGGNLATGIDSNGGDPSKNPGDPNNNGSDSGSGGGFDVQPTTNEQPQTAGTPAPGKKNPNDPDDPRNPPTPGTKTDGGTTPPPCNTPDCNPASGSGSGQGQMPSENVVMHRQLANGAWVEIIDRIDLTNPPEALR